MAIMDLEWGDGNHHHAFSFGCKQCGILGICSHKKETAASIRFAPQHERTARELASSSKMERELVWADMTANPHASHYNEYIRIEEDHPDLVQSCLLQMGKELSKYDRQHNTNNRKNHKGKDGGVAGGEAAAARDATNTTTLTAYEEALQLSQASYDYVTSKELRVMFLRAERYNVRDACRRLVQNFQLKKDLFGGGEVLGRPLNFHADLTQEEQQILKDGRRYRFLLKKKEKHNNSKHHHHHNQSKQQQQQQDQQQSSFDEQFATDHAGRFMLFTRAAILDFDENDLRCAFFLIHNMAHNSTQFQKLGCILISYALDGFSPTFDYEFVRRMCRNVLAGPMRLVTMYTLIGNKNGTDQQRWNTALDFGLYIMGKLIRLRARAIRGSEQECLYDLLCLGFSPTTGAIPAELLYNSSNSSEDGTSNKKKKNHHRLYQDIFGLPSPPAVVEEHSDNDHADVDDDGSSDDDEMDEACGDEDSSSDASMDT